MNYDNSVVLNQEREINLVTLMLAVLRKWKMLLLLGLLFAIAFVGLSYMKQKKEVAANLETLAMQKEAEEDILDFRGEMTTLIDFTSQKNRILETIQKKAEYLEKSELAKIDPMSEARARVEYVVSFDEIESGFTNEVIVGGDIDEERAADIAAGEAVAVSGRDNLSLAEIKTRNLLDFYSSYAQHRSNLNKSSETLGVEQQFVRELVSSNTDDGFFYAYCEVRETTPEKADIIMKDVMESIIAAKGEATELYGEHELTFRNRVTKIITNQSRTTWLNDRMKEINDLMNNYNLFVTNEEKITADTETVIEVENETLATSISKRAMAKYGVLGFILGMLAGAFGYIVNLLMSSKVLSGRDLNSQFGLRKLAALPPKGVENMSGFKKRLAIYDIKYASNPDEDKCFEMAGENIRTLLGEDNKVALVGDIASAEIDGVMEKLNGLGANVAFKSVADLSDPTMLRELEDCKSAILVASPMESKYSSIEELLKTLTDSGKKVLGSIVI